MPELQFYAADDDALAIVDLALAEPESRLYELASRANTPLRAFASTAEVRAALLDASGARVSIHLALWVTSFEALPIVRRVELQLAGVPGAGYRETLDGWGLIHLQFSRARNDSLSPSRIAHNSAARARTWEAQYHERLGPAGVWNWRAVEQIAARLKRQIRHHLAVRKHGRWLVLRGAAELADVGIVLAAV